MIATKQRRLVTEAIIRKRQKLGEKKQNKHPLLREKRKSPTEKNKSHPQKGTMTYRGTTSTANKAPTADLRVLSHRKD